MAAGALALKKHVHGMPALGWWLMAVGVVRFALTSSCFFSSASLCSATFSETQVSGVHGRTFAVWTLLSCTLCFLCAFNLGRSSRPLYVATFMSFVYALGAECVVYHTISAASLAPFVFIAGSVWNAGISQELHRNFTRISSFSQEKVQEQEKIPHSKQALNAGTSIVWMQLQWNAQLGHAPRPRGATATSNSKQT